jgi:hypothetical protein
MILRFHSREEMTKQRMVPVKGLYGEIRAFDEEMDADFIRMRMTATWKAQETMERGVSETDSRS